MAIVLPSVLITIRPTTHFQLWALTFTRVAAHRSAEHHAVHYCNLSVFIILLSLKVIAVESLVLLHY
jgi:hypothetical protein